MKKALLLFSRHSAEAKKTHPDDLARILNEAKKGIEAHSAFFEDLLFHIEERQVDVVDTANKCPLTDYDVIYFRHWSDALGPAMAAARFCTIRDIAFVDSEVYRPGSANKITQYMNLYQAGVPFPKTMVAAGEQLLAKYVEYEFVFPLIVKSTTGSRGTDNYVVRDEAELRRILHTNPDITFVMQSFIPNNGDYRVIVMGDEIPMVIARKAASKDTHLNNTSQGGSATLVDPKSLPPEVLQQSVRAAHFFGCQIAGVDMVRSQADGRYYCFEVNRSPQIEHSSFEFEKAAYLADYLRQVAISGRKPSSLLF